MEERTKTPFWKPAFIYGVIVGFVGILIGVIFYVMDLSVETWTQWVTGIIGLAILIYCVVNYRNEDLGGYASFGQIWKMTIVIGIIGTIISTIYTYILMGLIDPELIDKMKMVQEQKLLNNPRIPEAFMDTALERLDKSMSLNRIMIMGLIMGPVMYSILGLIIAAFVKKNNPADNVV